MNSKDKTDDDKGNSWSDDGMCPDCGRKLVRTSSYDTMALTASPDGADWQVCMSCGWESEINYDR